MFGIYLIAFIPCVIGAVLWVKYKRIVWFEWLIGCALAFVVAGAIHVISIWGVTNDREIWSGRLVQAVRVPRWVEEYQVPVYTTTIDAKGNPHTTFSHFETRHRTHPEHFYVVDFYGAKTIERPVSKSFYENLVTLWQADIKKQRGYRPGYDSGDRYDYVADETGRFLFPTSMFVSFENRVKACPSVFSYVQPPENSGVFDYPKDIDWSRSNRLLGTATKINQLEWDRMNARLGALKKVNVILIGFNSPRSELGQLQEAKYIGGKKNDLVLCYGQAGGKVAWTYVFGWTNKDVVKRNLETVLLKNPIDTDIISKIEPEIKANYVKKNWHDFDYLTIVPPWWSYILMVGVSLVTQSLYILWAFKNRYGNERNHGWDSWSQFRYGFYR